MTKLLAPAAGLLALVTLAAPSFALRPEPRRVPDSVILAHQRVPRTVVSPTLGQIRIDVAPAARVSPTEAELAVTVSDSPVGMLEMAVEVTFDGARIAGARIPARSSVRLTGQVKADLQAHEVVVRVYRFPLDRPPHLAAERRFTIFVAPGALGERY